MRSSCARSAALALNFPKPTEYAIEAGDDVSARLRFERDVTAKPGGKSCRRCPSPSLCSGSAQAGMTSGMGVNRIELVFRQRPVAQSELYRNIVKPARREAAIEMPQSRNDHPDDRDLDVGTRLIEDEEIEALSLGDIARRPSPARACRDGRTSSRSPAGPPASPLGVK